jgi:uncharacterized protein YlzI (FlbEa/FlbD family)
MIILTKLDKSKVLVSLDNIKYVEAVPDTLIRFVNGDMLIVCEGMAEIAEIVETYKVRCLSAAQKNSAGATRTDSFSGGHEAWT